MDHPQQTHQIENKYSELVGKYAVNIDRFFIMSKIDKFEIW